MRPPPRVVQTSLAAVPLLLGLMLGATARGQEPPAGLRRVPVLAELFTSEGCSSCPAADDLLRRLVAEQPVDGVEVIALSEHVDYWDRLGWKDSFSSSAFSRRQEDYGRALRREPIFTPQLVVDGRMQAIGSDWSEVRRTLVEAARTPRASVAVTAEAQQSTLTASIGVVVRDLPASAAKGDVDVYVAVVENDLTTEVLRGENAKKQLHHSAVARSLTKIGSLGKTETAGEFTQAVPLDRAWRTDNLRAVAFLQDSRSRHVLGAGVTRIR
jgi:hypothetical protein